MVELPIFIKDLNAMVVFVTDRNVAIVKGGHTFRRLKLPRPKASTSKFKEHLPVEGQHQTSMVATVRHHHST